MNHKTLLALILASAFGLSHSVVYADDDKKPTQPAPELIAEGDEKPTQPAPELIAEGDEKPTQPAPELISA